MTRYLYIFPHPDDESFGPAPAIAAQRRQGHEVHLLTLTRGGATKVRHELGLSIEEMGEVRLSEMEQMARVLDLSSMTVLDLPDSELKEMDPREIEAVVARHIEQLQPSVVVSYPAYGISGFDDHLVTHAIVKRVFCALREKGQPYLRRLAFTTLEKIPHSDRPVQLRASRAQDIDCAVPVTAEDREAQRRALDCYRTYQHVIARIDPAALSGDDQYFEIFQEDHQPPLTDLAEGL
jgi:LmbE family N-acetylglucosaminyl deacetylase